MRHCGKLVYLLGYSSSLRSAIFAVGPKVIFKHINYASWWQNRTLTWNIGKLACGVLPVLF